VQNENWRIFINFNYSFKLEVSPVISFKETKFVFEALNKNIDKYL